MRLLLAHNSTYYPAHGGGDKSNRLLMEALAAAGHTCRVVARTATFDAGEHGKLLSDLAQRSITPSRESSGVVVFPLRGVEVHTATASANLRALFTTEIESFQPDVILTSTDDPAQLLLEAALRATAHVVYLARATLALPFGPDCAFPSEQKTAALRRVNAIVGVSQYVADYIRRWSGVPATHVPISLMEGGPYPDLGRPDNEFVTMVNPCAVKGITIFTGLSEAFPQIRFAAVPTWGTSDEDLAELRQRPNITVLPPVDNIDELLVRSRVLLVPSLWAEARSRIVVEAMLRGVPVLAAEIGGIPEAKMGVPYLLPVTPITRYERQLDAQMVPIADVPPQDLAPWSNALARVLEDSAHYTELSHASRAAALQYAENLSVQPFADLLAATVAKPIERTSGAPAASGLSPEKRRLLALRLRQQAAVKPDWFPGIEQATASVRLFCLPYAGAGTSAFRGWAGHLQDVAVCPVRLPGRESRHQEPLLTTMEELVGAIASALRPHLNRPYAFYGHSMGAAVAFELARRLREMGAPLPFALIAGAARAPQLRLHYTPGPEPSDEELREQLQRLSPDALDEDTFAQLLPTLRADTRLYRQYRYTPGEPLSIPLCIYTGADDPNVRPEHLEPWCHETTAPCIIRTFAGGHFFLHESRQQVLASLLADLREARAVRG